MVRLRRKTEATSIRYSQRTREMLEQLADHLGVSQNQVIERAIENLYEMYENRIYESRIKESKEG